MTAWRWVGLLLALAVIIGAAALACMVVDHALGRLSSASFLLFLFLAGVGAIEMVGKLGVRSGRAALLVSTSLALLVLALFVFELREPTRRAIAARRGATSASANAKPAKSPPPKTSALPPAEPSSSAVHVDAARFAFNDRNYTEPGDTCATLVDVDDLASAYRSEALRATIEAVAKRRYPTGLPFLQAQDDATLATWQKGAPATFEGLISRFDASVHEGSHIWGAKHAGASTVAYPVRADLTIEARRLRTFDRSEIMSLLGDEAKDTYAVTYLTGSTGAQGFDTLLDEYNAYTHSLAARVCTRDLLPTGSKVSARDGILAMMHYVELYLRVAREKHVADYAAILKDPGHRRLILTVWSRAELWLRRSAPYPSLGIHDDRLEAFAYEPDNLAEIARVRDAP